MEVQPRIQLMEDKLKKLEFTTPTEIVVNTEIINKGSVIGKSYYGAELHHRGNEENLLTGEISHIIREFVSIADPTRMGHKQYMKVEFIENCSMGEASKKVYELIESGKANGTIKPIPVLMGNVLVRVDLFYETPPQFPDAFKKYMNPDIKDKFKDIDDMKALDLCQRLKDTVEIVSDNDGSWVQLIDGTEEEDIVYEFELDFGARDGVFNLFKKLGIKAKQA